MKSKHLFTKIFAPIFAFVLIFVCSLPVHAGTTNLAITGPDEVKNGDTITLAVTASDLIGFDQGLSAAQGDIVYDSEYLTYVGKDNGDNGLTSSFGTSTNRFVAIGLDGEYIASRGNLISLTFRAKKVGTTTISLANVTVADTKSISHTANLSAKTIKITESNNDNSGSSSSGSGQTSSSDSGTSNTSSSSGGGSNNYYYYNTSNINNSSSSLSSDCTLSQLLVNNAKVSPAFNKNTLSYDVVVPAGTTSLDLIYTPSDTNALVEVKGNGNFTNGDNIVQIIVEAEDGSKNTYFLNVKITAESSSNRLASLNVGESDLTPRFSPYTNEYTVKIGTDISRLTISAIAEDSDSTVEIIDNQDLDKKEAGVVLVRVTDRNGFSNYYKLRIDNSGGILAFIHNNRVPLAIGLSLLACFVCFFFFLLFSRRSERQEPDTINLYDSVVTPTELIAALEESAITNDDTKLDILFRQDKANKLKEQYAKDELVDALASNDKKSVKRIQKDLKAMKGGLSASDEELRDQLIDAIKKDDNDRIQDLMKLQGHHK